MASNSFSILPTGPKPAQIPFSIPLKCLPARLLYNDFDNRSSRASNIRSASFEFSSKNSVGEIDFEQIKGDIRDLVGRISQAAKDRDESLHQVASLKRQNDQLLENTVGLEEKLSTQKKKSRSFEDQLRKVELKVAHSDANLADQVIFT